MKKSFLFVLLLCLCGISKAQEISKDKYLHFGAGVVIGGIGGYAAHKIFDGDPYWTWTGAVGSSLAAGMVKEAIDKADYGVWDNSDILFTTLGGLASGLALELLLRNKRRRGRGRACNCNALNLKRSVSTNETIFNITSFKSHDITSTFQAQRILREGL